MSAPAAKTFSPPYTTTARIASSAVTSRATARSSSWSWMFSAFIGGRLSRIVPMPSALSSCTSSPTVVSPSFFLAAYPLAHRAYRRRGVAMVLYYRDDFVRVSSTVIHTRDRSYPVSQLDDVWLERGP